MWRCPTCGATVEGDLARALEAFGDAPLCGGHWVATPALTRCCPATDLATHHPVEMESV